jgi:hypothetical protein
MPRRLLAAVDAGLPPNLTDEKDAYKSTLIPPICRLLRMKTLKGTRC